MDERLTQTHLGPVKPYLDRSWWMTLSNGQEIFDWQRARYTAWQSQIDAVEQQRAAHQDLWIDRVARGEGCA